MTDYYGDKVTVVSQLLVGTKNNSFIHGSAILSNQKLVVLYYFDDIQTGLAMVTSMNGMGNTDFFRLTAYFVKDKPPSNLNIMTTTSSITQN